MLQGLPGPKGQKGEAVGLDKVDIYLDSYNLCSSFYGFHLD